MAALYSARLLGWADETSPPAYESPSGYLTIVRDVDVWSGGGSIINYQLQVNDLARFWAGQFTVLSLAQVAQWRGRQVILPGELLVFTSDGATDGLISGYQLSIP